MRIDGGSVTAVGVVQRLLAPRSPIATRRDSSSSAILQLNGGGAQNLSSGEPWSAGIGRIVVAAMAMLTAAGHVVAADLPTPSSPAPSAPNWTVKAVYLFVDLTDLHDRGELRRRRWLHIEFQRKHHTRRHQFQIPGALWGARGQLFKLC
jgi:hypothetical protein